MTNLVSLSKATNAFIFCIDAHENQIIIISQNDILFGRAWQCRIADCVNTQTCPHTSLIFTQLCMQMFFIVLHCTILHSISICFCMLLWFSWYIMQSHTSSVMLPLVTGCLRGLQTSHSLARADPAKADQTLAAVSIAFQLPQLLLAFAPEDLL